MERRRRSRREAEVEPPALPFPEEFQPRLPIALACSLCLQTCSLRCVCCAAGSLIVNNQSCGNFFASSSSLSQRAGSRRGLRWPRPRPSSGFRSSVGRVVRREARWTRRRSRPRLSWNGSSGSSTRRVRGAYPRWTRRQARCRARVRGANGGSDTSRGPSARDGRRFRSTRSSPPTTSPSSRGTCVAGGSRS